MIQWAQVFINAPPRGCFTVAMGEVFVPKEATATKYAGSIYTSARES